MKSTTAIQISDVIRCKFLTTFCFVLFASFQLFSQDPIFTQFYASPVYLNPVSVHDEVESEDVVVECAGLLYVVVVGEGDHTFNGFHGLIQESGKIILCLVT